MTGTVVPIIRPINWKSLRADEAERLVRTRAQNKDNIIDTYHGSEREEERSELVSLDMYDILETGYVTEQPERSDKDPDDWVVQVEKRMPGGREAAVITVIVNDTDDLVVVTIQWND